MEPLGVCTDLSAPAATFKDAIILIQDEQQGVLLNATLSWFQVMAGFSLQGYKQTYAVRQFSNNLHKAVEDRFKRNAKTGFGAASKQFGSEVCK